MKLTRNGWLCGAGGQGKQSPGVVVVMALGLLVSVLAHIAGAQAVSTTTVQGTVYLANGQAGSGTLRLSWPAFTTASGQAVAADSMNVAIAPDGFVSVNLSPNLGATPAGLYYTAVFYMSDGTTSTEYWVVPSAAQASLAQVQSQLMPAAQAVEAVSKAYVDQSIAALSQSQLAPSGGTLSGPLYLSGDPTQALQAADKHYVDTTVATAVPLAGGNMTGALSTPAVNGVQAPTPNSSQTTLQAAMNAAGTNGAMEIPPAYVGADGFTNPNGVHVTDLRTSGAQPTERSVKEFGAVCDGVTDDTNALQAALNYAQAHGVALTIPQGICKTRTLNWRGESIGGMGKEVSALLGFPGQDVLASLTDTPNFLQFTRLHDLTIYVDQSVDASCSPAEGRAAAGSCTINRPLEINSIFSRGGNGLTGTIGTGAGWAIGNCAIAMPAVTGTGGNGLRVAEIENVEIAATGVDPMGAQYPGVHSTHTCGMYLAQWPQWSEFRNIDIRGLNTGIAMPALPGTTPAGLNADSNRWQNITIQATHGFTAAAGSNNTLDSLVAMAGNSSAAGEAPTGLVLDLTGIQQGWTVRNTVVIPSWNAVQPQLTMTSASGAVTAVALGSEHGLGFDPYGAQVPLSFSGSCTAAATANVNSDGSIGTITVTQGGTGCSGTTTASVNVAGTWDTAAAVNLIGGQSMSFFGGNLLKGNGGYTVWNAAGSSSYGTQLNGGGGALTGGGTYVALVNNSPLGTTYAVDQFPGADFGAKLQSCLGAVSALYGGNCDARNFSGNLSMGSNLTVSTGNTTVQLPCATIATANQIVVTAGARNVTLRGCALRGGSAVSGSQGGTVFAYSGTGAMVQVGDPTYATDTQGFHIDNAVINTTGATSATAQGLLAYRTQEMDLESLYFLGNANQTGMTLDGTGNYTGGTYFDIAINGFQAAVNAIGHQVSNAATTDWVNASTFVRLHINCPTSGGSPIAGTYGINLQQGDGNTFTGGDVEGCATALHLGPNAQNNTIVGLRNENSTNQVVADSGSAYNNWMTGGTMFTGKLTDNGTRNSFLDTFHRSFNGMNGDWYLSQQDATLTNHYRLGTAMGNERGLLNRYQTDYGYRWTMGLSDATAGEQFYQVLDELNNVYRLSIGQYNNGQPSTNNQTVINSAGTGAVVLNDSNNAGTGGVVIGSGGASVSTVATINSGGNAQFNGSLQVGGTSTFTGSTTVKNQVDAEIDQVLWAGATTGQKESLTYKDWNGNSQWYVLKDASNNWALNSATGGLDSFKAYQSTNSGDTYVDASNASGMVRVNYETGAGTGFKVYGGNSNTVYASFTGATSIQFPGLAASSSRSCLQIDNSGYVTNTGSACGSSTGGSGTVTSANAGQIAYYASNGSSVGGMNTVPLTAGGTGSATAAGALQNLGGISSNGTAQQTMAGPLTANVNGVDAITAFGAKGDCTGSGSTATCTDNHSAIQAAIDAAYASGASVYFPTNPSAANQTVYYTSLPVNPKGVSMYGPPGASGPANYWTTALPVAVRGAPSQDVFAVVDAANAGFVTPLTSFAVRDLGIIVDGSVDASANFPTRRPGRSVQDAVMSSGSAVVTSATAEFMPGDVGQTVTVSGAGAASATLSTTIASWQSATQVTLAASASTAVTAATLYISVMNLPTTQNIGNCAFAYDDKNGAFTGLAPDKADFSNLVITTISSWTNNTCGFFFQGNEAPTWTRWSNSFVGATFPFAYVPQNGVAPTNTQWTGQNDYNEWDHVWISGKYPFLSYTGGYGTINDMQISGALYGPHFLNAYGLEGNMHAWTIDIPELEVDPALCSSSSYIAFRISGQHEHVKQLGLGLCTAYLATFQWDASGSDANMNLSHVGAFNITGDLNTFDIPYNADFVTSSATFNVTGRGNTVATGSSSNPYDGIQPGRKQMVGGVANPTALYPDLSRPDYAFARTHDFLNGNAASPYFNAEDLWIWPTEVGNNTGSAPTLARDTSSESGWNMLSATGTPYYLTESNGTNWIIGQQFPAGKVRIYYKMKAAAASTTEVLGVSVNEGGTWTSISGCTNPVVGTSYGIYTCDADLTGLNGDGIVLQIGGSGFPNNNVYLAWIGVRPIPSDLPTTTLQLAGGATMTGNHGTGTNVQHSDGTGASGDLAKYASDGSVTDGPQPPSGAIVGTSDTQTLTNKSIAASEINSGTMSCSQMPALTGDATNTAGACATTVAQVNGAAIPASKARLATDSSGHIVAAANTLGCLDGYDHLPCTVFVQTNVSESTATGSYGTVLTTTNAGTYRITGYIYGTTASSTAYSVSNYVKATQGGQSSGNGYLVASAQIGTSISSGSAFAYIFPLSAGTAVQTESLTASGTNTGGVWSHAIIVERLQ
ncbi:MAG: hypothetical protein WA802_08625 [Terracidiphilus sp.]